MKNNILILAGDGIGPEIIAQAKLVLSRLQGEHRLPLSITEAAFGGAAIDQFGRPFPEETLALAKTSDAVLLGAIGGPQWDHIDRQLRPESALLTLRRELGVFANLRPAVIYPELLGASSLRPELIEKLNILIVRELTGGIYFGEPRGIEKRPKGGRVAYNTLVYSEEEIQRVAKIAFEIAATRSGRLCSVDKANVLETSMLWRDVVTAMAENYPEVTLHHMYVDNAAMQMARNPTQFDVIVTENMFGDILSDLSATLTGSIGMLASASLNTNDKGVFEPIHGSAPDIAGSDCANPLAAILSVAMMFKFSLGLPKISEQIEEAVKRVLRAGLRTADIHTKGTQLVGTIEMGEAVVAAL